MALAAGLLINGCKIEIDYAYSATVVYENKSGVDIKVLSVRNVWPDTVEVFSLKADSVISFQEYNMFTLTSVPVSTSFCDRMDHALIIFGGKDTVVHRIEYIDMDIDNLEYAYVPSMHNICDISSYELSYTGRYHSVQTYTITEADRYNHQ